ncbi:unnamed protein product [Moneuplotes crassus]|uniref:Membrane transporter protein n=1 Tax=Euplotes crassus TaxID=5936 RepID=A0AAD1UDY6_EUPCR|nr:unnamed protein product [Moneuplotes crassus]
MITGKNLNNRGRSKWSLALCILLLATLVAANETVCQTNQDCNDRYHCNTCKQECERDDLFPLAPFDYFGIVIMAILMSLSIAAGIGGGEIIVPIIKICFGFAQKEASPISQCCIMMAGITRFIINYRKKHPHRNKVPIDYNAAMILLPAIFFGASLGHMLHKLMPNLLQEVLLTAVLVY